MLAGGSPTNFFEKCIHAETARKQSGPSYQSYLDINPTGKHSKSTWKNNRKEKNQAIKLTLFNFLAKLCVSHCNKEMQLNIKELILSTTKHSSDQ